MESSRTSLASRTDFEVLGLGLEASSPLKLACPRLEDSSIFWIVKISWSAWKIFWKTFVCGDRLKNFCEDLFFFFLESTCACVLGLWPPLASRVSVLGRAVLGLGFFLCPGPRALCPRLHLWLIVPFWLFGAAICDDFFRAVIQPWCVTDTVISGADPYWPLGDDLRSLSIFW